MEITSLSTDQAVLEELGKRLARRRVELELTQAELANQAGVAKRTVERIESGGSAQMSSLIRVLRSLEVLPRLEVLLPEVEPSPLEWLERKGKVRQRVRAGRARPEKPWTWDDQT